MRVLIFDTETTGLPKSKRIDKDSLYLWPYIVQFSYVIYNISENKIESKVDSIIKIPESIEISPECIQIHGITKEMSLSKGKSIKEILFTFVEDFDSCDLIVGHNISFDLRMVKVEILRLIKTLMYFEKRYLDNFIDEFCDVPSIKVYCTMQSSIELCGLKIKDKNGNEYSKFPKLMELYSKLFDIQPKNLHNSFHDVLICLRCFCKLKYDMDIYKENKEIQELFVSLDL